MIKGLEHTLRDFNRLPLEMHKNAVKEVLPTYFTTEYPNLVLFLEYYYEYMDEKSFGSLINDIYTCRDAEDNSLEHLDLMVNEFVMGVGVAKFDKEPREIIRNFAKFYRVKGSKYSAEGFFRAFFGTDAVVHYPKNDLFYLNDSASTIGVDAQKVIQDGKIYQLLSHLVRTDVGLPDWQELYKKFVHPAGFHLGAEIVIQEPAINTIISGVTAPLFDLSPTILFDIASISDRYLYDSLGIAPIKETLQSTDITQLVSPTINGSVYNLRLHTGPLRFENYLNRTIAEADAYYPTIYAWAAQTRQVWDTTTDSAALLRQDSVPLHFNNGIDSYGYFGVYPSFYVGTGDNPSYMTKPYPSIITTSLAYAEQGASFFEADSDMTQLYPLYDSDIVG